MHDKNLLHNVFISDILESDVFCVNYAVMKMNNRYIVFDVETPNFRNDRMSSIGVTVVENGEITEKYYSLVNPECEFDRFNIELTKITPEMVKEKANFERIWIKLERIMDKGILVAHNAPFDMSVLAKCLKDYGIEWKPYVYYACTCAMGKVFIPGSPDHKLNTLCDRLNIRLMHHNAGSDSYAAAELLCHYLKKGADTGNFIRKYDMQRIKTVRRRG